jgi:hypothetical protein
MCYWLLPESGKPIVRTLIQVIKEEEMQTEEVKNTLATLEKSVEEKLQGNGVPVQKMELYLNNKDLDDETIPIQPEFEGPDVDNIKTDAYNELLLTELQLIRDGDVTRAKIVGQIRDGNGNLIGT